MPTPPLLAVTGQDLQVPIASGEMVRYVNLDYAASSPALREVQGAVDALMPWYSSMRGTGFASSVCSDVLEGARDSIKSFLGARSDDVVILTRNTTDALNLLASVIPPSTTVVSFASEHHSNLLPWLRMGGGREHFLLPVPHSMEEIVGNADAALSAAKTEHKLLVVTGASNVTGELWPIERLAEVARRHGARFAVDGAQLAPHRPIDMAAAGIDWLAISGHKLYAPYGTGALVGRRDWLDRAPPYLAGGGAATLVTPSATHWAEGAARHEAGTSNLLGAAALGASCRMLQSVGMEAVATHERGLLEQATAGLRSIPRVSVISLLGAGSERIGLVAFTIEGLPHNLASMALSVEHGIGVRDGAFCAHLLVADLITGRRFGLVRASFGVGSRQDDIVRLISAVATLAVRGPRLQYQRDEQSGAFVPVGGAFHCPAIHPLLNRA